MYDEIRTVINAAQGLIIQPGWREHLPFGSARPALYVRFDIRVSAPYDEESGGTPLLVSRDLHMIVTQPHHVFFSTVDEGWTPPPLDTFRCVSAHDSCWRDGLNSYISKKVYDSIRALGLASDVQSYAMSRDGIYTTTEWQMFNVQMQYRRTPEAERLGYDDQYSLTRG